VCCPSQQAAIFQYLRNNVQMDGTSTNDQSWHNPLALNCMLVAFWHRRETSPGNRAGWQCKRPPSVITDVRCLWQHFLGSIPPTRDHGSRDDFISSTLQRVIKEKKSPRRMYYKTYPCLALCLPKLSFLTFVFYFSNSKPRLADRRDPGAPASPGQGKNKKVGCVEFPFLLPGKVGCKANASLLFAPPFFFPHLPLKDHSLGSVAWGSCFGMVAKPGWALVSKKRREMEGAKASWPLKRENGMRRSKQAEASERTDGRTDKTGRSATLGS
jgi:hypothetical protein